MTASDLLSVAALAVSIFTLYWTALRSGTLEASTPNVIALTRDSSGHPALGTTLLISNTGARPVQVNHLYARLLDGRSQVVFDCTFEGPFRDAMEEVELTQTNVPQSFLLAAGAGITQHLYFTAREAMDFPLGRFEIEFVADLVREHQEATLASRTIELHERILPGRFVEAVATRRREVIVIKFPGGCGELQQHRSPRPRQGLGVTTIRTN